MSVFYPVVVVILFQGDQGDHYSLRIPLIRGDHLPMNRNLRRGSPRTGWLQKTCRNILEVHTTQSTSELVTKCYAVRLTQAHHSQNAARHSVWKALKSIGAEHVGWAETHGYPRIWTLPGSKSGSDEN